MAEELHLVPPVATINAAEAEPRVRLLTRRLLACGIAALTAAGCLGIYRELAALWIVWTNDPLRSIGMLIPPVSIALTLLVWRQLGWQMRGTWWGLMVIALSYLLSLFRQKIVLLAVLGVTSFSFIPTSLPVYVYGSGIVLLFGGTQVWRKAWFPLALSLLSQPVPLLANGLIDVPLQNISARVARSFATLIHFAPTTPQLHLMFSPDFGMFIAPGCDGIRGAVAMGYVALIAAYLKRFAWILWAAYVAGAVLLGYLFNFIRLCILVLYYRIALGHPPLEGVAKQADYAIGSCLFLIATLLFVWLASRKAGSRPAAAIAPPKALPAQPRSVWIKCSAFSAIVMASLALPSSALHYARARAENPESFASRMPRQIGSFTLTRTWYERLGGTPVLQAGAYSAPGSDEVIVGVWIEPLSYLHDANNCWLTRGLQPESLSVLPFRVVGGQTVHLSTGFYSDGISDSIVLSAPCTPESCLAYTGASSRGRHGIVFLAPAMSALTTSEEHLVSIMVRIDRPRSNSPDAATRKLLSDEAERFLDGFNPTGLSHAFQ